MKQLLETLCGKKSPYVPTWFMRQAGRYLPEYREVRKNAGSFLDLCYTPNLAREVTLQPIRRFDLDGAIIFSDILVVPHAMGFHLRFQEGEGPLLEKVDLATYRPLRDKVPLSHFIKRLEPVYEAISTTKQSLPSHVTLIGFAGAPWTLACYMLQGKGGKSFFEARVLASKYPNAFRELLKDLSFYVAAHLRQQIAAGVEVVQLFDSWAGEQDAFFFKERCVGPIKNISGEIKKVYPSVPFVHFPRKASAYYKEFDGISTLDALSIDEFIPLSFAKDHLKSKVFQGNLSPATLLAGGKAMIDETTAILSMMEGLPFVFNLGHGIDKETPIEHVKQVLDCVKKHNEGRKRGALQEKNGRSFV